MKLCVVVLGMHRSGTSAITGLLSLSGYDLGFDLVPAQQDNPKGFFENAKVVKLNDEILAEKGSAYDDVNYKIKFSQSDLDEYADRAKVILKEEFQYCNRFALKDPRLCLTYPVWKRALNELGVKIKVIIPLRQPFEVASSLKRRNKFSIEKGLFLWLKHFFHSELSSRVEDRLFLNFQEIVDDYRLSLEGVFDFLADEESANILRSGTLSNFIEKQLKHENLSIKNFDESLPGFLQGILNELFGEDLQKHIDTKRIDSLRQEFETSLSLFHNPQVLYYTDYSKELHAQRNKAREESLAKKDVIESLESRLESKEESIKNLEVEIASKSNKIESLENNLHSLKDALDKASSDLVKSTCDMSALQLSLASKKSASQEALIAKDKAIDELESKLGELQLSMTSKDNDWQKKIIGKDEAISDIENRLAENLRIKDDQLVDLKKQLSLEKERVDQLVHEKNRNKSEFLEQRQRWILATKEHQQLLEKLKVAESIIADKDKKIEEVLSDFVFLKKAKLE